MGCCCSFFKKKNKKQDDDLAPLITNDNNDGFGQGIDNYDLLEDFADNLINVESYEIAPQEYERRSKVYKERLKQINLEISCQRPCLLEDIPNPEIVLASTSIDSDNEKMIKDFLKAAVEALEDIKIKHEEDLISPFPP